MKRRKSVPQAQPDEAGGVATLTASEAPAVPEPIAIRTVGYCPSCNARLWESVPTQTVFNCPNSRGCGRTGIKMSEVTRIEPA